MRVERVFVVCRHTALYKCGFKKNGDGTGENSEWGRRGPVDGLGTCILMLHLCARSLIFLAKLSIVTSKDIWQARGKQQSGMFHHVSGAGDDTLVQTKAQMK
jgi:hypothetical protein